MTVKGYPAAVAAAVMLGLLVAHAGSQATRPADEPQTSKPAEQIVQPAEFVKLAAKARKFKAVYARGAGYVETSEPLEEPLPPEMRKVDFEVWIVPPLAKTVLQIPSEVRVSDGKYVYTLAYRPDAPPQGRRRQITPTSFYHVLDMAAVYCDAAGGYDNLTQAVKFGPVAAPGKFAEKFPLLRWFQLHAATDPVHHLVEGTEWVKMGLDPKDGLVRVIVGAKLKRGKNAEDWAKDPVRVEISVVFEEVRHGAIKQSDLKLPAEAAHAPWIDGDTGRPIRAPSELITSEKPRP